MLQRSSSKQKWVVGIPLGAYPVPCPTFDRLEPHTLRHGCGPILKVLQQSCSKASAHGRLLGWGREGRTPVQGQIASNSEILQSINLKSQSPRTLSFP